MTIYSVHLRHKTLSLKKMISSNFRSSLTAEKNIWNLFLAFVWDLYLLWQIPKHSECRESKYGYSEISE